ncbi:hypothetical protein HC028_10985 [Planosporangium flavigriseum]|uniref:Anti-sigma-D factor RsdA sigma factor binding region domain-containing protein n=1 Tax=Planosporangium flavigriseum TaxID=373681 RepID=A0A8J3LJ76_9ACTN|nr:hypothetical protein [Planosporangium flavigriseum]NJC65024.1 hypothetical protein [Planosporangium flavigriseum]GIG71638.1 hypothetical protein Pfl04_00420 [Planosporangium flavigriseum]
MTDKPSTAGERPSDLGAVAADTLLLDALGRGAPALADDQVASLLAAWRADLDDGLAVTESDQAADPAVVRLVGAERRGDRTRRTGRRVLGAAAAVLVAGGGLLVGAEHATPGNPLWPITRVMYPERADSVVAEHTLAQAREAAADGRQDDARRLLAEAATVIGHVSDEGTAQRLRAELATVRGMLPPAVVPAASAPAVPDPAPTGAVVPGSPGAPTAGPVPQPTGGAPQPTVTSGATPPGVSVPLLPTVPAPSTGLRLPSTVAPTLPPVGGLLPPLP